MTSTIHLRRDLLARGFTDTEIRTAVRQGTLIRLAPGSFVPGEQYRSLDREDRYRLMVQAVARHRDDGVVASHSSAAALHGLPLVRTPLELVHLTRAGRGGARRTDRVQVHSADVPPGERTRIDDVAVTTVDRTLIDLARAESRDTSVTAIDAALHEQLVPPQRLVASLAAARCRPGIPRARRALALADGRAESPGETLTRLSLIDHGILDLEPQVWIVDECGRRVARVDLALLAYGVLLEFDGFVKYERLLRPGESPSDAVVREKRREERVTELGWLVIRVIWADLRRPDLLARRVQDACRARVRLVRAGSMRGSIEHTEPVRVAVAG